MPKVPGSELDPDFEQVLGYLNFATGATDVKVLRALDRLFQWAESESDPYRVVINELLARLDQFHREERPAFTNVTQAAEVLRRTRDEVLPRYREFHRDILFHLPDQELFTAYFLGRLFQAALTIEREVDDYVDKVVRHLNDFIGHRPVPVLESQEIEPYAHEWVRPIPLYVRDAGVCHGHHQQVLERALELLGETDEDLCLAACFNPELLDEVSLDPRAYDFDHPVNKRPNYHFGQWDPNLIDNQGYYRRFVIQRVTLDSLLQRVIDPSEIPLEERIEEAGAVLAGTILMAAGVSGWGPGSHSSEVTLGNLLPRIAAYRDEFYKRLIEKMSEPHRTRLKEEALARRQPFGAARQHLNAELGNRRAMQLQHVVLARIFAAMGHPEAAQRQVDQVRVASARMTCSLECLLTSGDRAARQGEIATAIETLESVRGLLIRAIECGALADPWSVLGFDTNFSLFPALENSVHDHRIDELVDLVERIFQLHARVWSEAAARDLLRDCENVEQLFQSLALWWRQFAVHEVSSIDCGDSQQAYLAAKHVADGLNLWHKGGASAGDIAFWRPHAAMFDSPKAYTLLIERMLERDDHVAAMALMVHWLSRSDELPLEQGDSSYHRCALQWLRAVRRHNDAPWDLTAKFLNYIEANAESYGEAPKFELGAAETSSRRGAAEAFDLPLDMEPDDENIYSSAYDDMVFRDSAEDGVDGELAGERSGFSDEDELARECQRVSSRLDFLSTLSTLWTMGSLPLEQSDNEDRAIQQRHWVKQANRVRQQLRELMESVAAYAIAPPMGDHDSMMEYDRRRLLKESLLEQVISTEVDVANAARMMTSALFARGETLEALDGLYGKEANDEEMQTAEVLGALLNLEPDLAAPKFDELLAQLEGEPLLYVPLSRGGSPDQIVSARIRQHCLRDLLKLLPRAGMLREVGEVLEAAREMERCQASILGAVTEFDELFTTGYGALVECLARSAKTWDESEQKQGLVTCLEQLTESVLISWLTHSRTLRLSVLERVSGAAEWQRLVEFIQNYGSDLFTQQFLNLGNVRAILHSGVRHWLEQMAEEPEALVPQLIRDLPTLDQDEVVEHLTVVLEAIIENYAEYRDYNSTTTMSDDGAMLYSLLDFLRLRARYDRVCWHLKPVVLAHQILVRNELTDAAELWRQALNERIDSEADRYLTQLRELQTNYAMRLPTIADRLRERFIKPLHVDRLVAFVRPAVAEAEHDDPEKCPTFKLLEEESEQMAQEPTGAGLDVPPWLLALEEEVQRVRMPEYDQELHIDELGLPNFDMSREDIEIELERWDD